MKHNNTDNKKFYEAEQELKKYLCIEDGERFVTDAKNMAEAKESAAMWNGEVIRELTAEESVQKPDGSYSIGD